MLSVYLFYFISYIIYAFIFPKRQKTTKTDQKLINSISPEMSNDCMQVKDLINENMSVKIWLPWKHKIPRTMTCRTKLLPDKFSIGPKVWQLLLRYWKCYKPLKLTPPGLKKLNMWNKHYIVGHDSSFAIKCNVNISKIIVIIVCPSSSYVIINIYEMTLLF